MGTFYNNANCDIYIGKGAGKKLLDDILNAKRTIKIISPYLSPSLIKELISLYERGINIHLVTTDTIEDFYGSYEKNIYKLINQHIILDKEAEKVRNKWIAATKILLHSTIGLTITLLLIACFYRGFELLYGFIPILILCLIRKLYKSKIKNKRIFNYRYSQLFPFKVFVSSKDSTFIHGKIYIIDDEIVYMGSLNFTGNGTKNNYETRIRTVDENAVTKIADEFDELFSHSGLAEKDTQHWGSQLYKEPIN